MIESPLAPGLLLAMPQLEDPNFRRSVVLMVEHNESGSFGLIINRPSNIKVGELLKLIEVNWDHDQDEVVGFGGPVMTQSAWLVHAPMPTDSPDDDNSHVVVPGISLTTSKDRLNQFAKTPPEHFRLLVGYAGWGPGQLAAELADGSWLQSEANPELVFEVHPELMWERAMNSIGVDPNFVAPSAGLN